ncbi:12432_t:CDS:1 [Ambispora leptoticha]|uniref:12432_t:CDS:1 n=1 Tax=Ambispora leptoticha TaxID=144679 RepID=A0A9N9F8B5_9GLOM|nr:12432_t:CDS:1 [Ambispora leptoticha]
MAQGLTEENNEDFWGFIFQTFTLIFFFSLASIIDKYPGTKVDKVFRFLSRTSEFFARSLTPIFMVSSLIGVFGTMDWNIFCTSFSRDYLLKRHIILITLAVSTLFMLLCFFIWDLLRICVSFNVKEGPKFADWFKHYTSKAEFFYFFTWLITMCMRFYDPYNLSLSFWLFKAVYGLLIHVGQRFVRVDIKIFPIWSFLHVFGSSILWYVFSYRSFEWRLPFSAFVSFILGTYFKTGLNDIKTPSHRYYYNLQIRSATLSKKNEKTYKRLSIIMNLLTLVQFSIEMILFDVNNPKASTVNMNLWHNRICFKFIAAAYTIWTQSMVTHSLRVISELVFYNSGLYPTKQRPTIYKRNYFEVFSTILGVTCFPFIGHTFTFYLLALNGIYWFGFRIFAIWQSNKDFHKAVGYVNVKEKVDDIKTLVDSVFG